MEILSMETTLSHKGGCTPLGKSRQSKTGIHLGAGARSGYWMNRIGSKAVFLLSLCPPLLTLRHRKKMAICSHVGLSLFPRINQEKETMEGCPVLSPRVAGEGERICWSDLSLGSKKLQETWPQGRKEAWHPGLFPLHRIRARKPSLPLYPTDPRVCVMMHMTDITNKVGRGDNTSYAQKLFSPFPTEPQYKPFCYS